MKYRSLYSVTKGGMEVMYRSLADEFSPDILVNTLAPGFTATDLTKRSLGPMVFSSFQKIPLTRPEPTEIANFIYLFS